MKNSDLLSSSIQFLFSSFLIVLGIATVAVSLVPAWYQRFVLFLSSDSFACLTVGFATLITGLSLLALFYWIHRGRYYHIKLSSCKATVHAPLIQESALRYFSSLDLPYPVDCHVVQLKSHRVILGLSLPSLAKQERQQLFTQVEQELPFLLQEQLGYTQPLELSILER